MSKDDAIRANKEAQDVQAEITRQWKNFATVNGRAAYEDLMRYMDDQREMFRKYAEDKAIPHPSKQGELVPIDNETVAALLQNSRGVNIIRTYISSRVNQADVAQPTKSK